MHIFWKEMKIKNVVNVNKVFNSGKSADVHQKTLQENVSFVENIFKIYIWNNNKILILLMKTLMKNI